MPNSIGAALNQLMGFDSSPQGMVATPYDGKGVLSPYLNSPDMVSNEPGMAPSFAAPNTFTAGADPGSFSPTANVPLPPPRPAGLLSAPAPAQDDDDGDAPAPSATPAGPAPAAAPQPAPGAAPPAMQAPAPAQGAPQAPGATGSSGDMVALYKELLDKSERKADFNSGMALIAGGLSGSPEGRAALYNMAAQGGGNSAQSSATNTLNTLMQLRQFSQKQQQVTAQQSRIPDIAAKLGISVDAAKYLDAAGKLDDLVVQAAKPDNQVSQLSDGRTVLISKTNGKIVSDFGGQKEDDKDPKQITLLNNMRTNWQSLGLPDPNSTNPADQQRWQDMTMRILAGGNGVSVSVNNTPEKAEAQAAGQAIGAAKGKEVASYIEDGNPALKQIQLLNTMQGALKASNGQYTGPFADYVLNGKQAVAGAFGLDLNLGPQETAQKLGFQLATQASKAISARPSQAEFLRALQNVPGIFQTPQGADALISITRQDAQDRVALSNLAHGLKPGDNMNDVAQKYYDTHPIMSPFTPGEAFGQNDINQLASGAAKNGQQGAQQYIKPTPTPAAIADLKAHPEHKDEFEAHFGKGTAYHFIYGAGAQQ